MSYSSNKFITRSLVRSNKVLSLYMSSSFVGPRPIHKEFTVEKATSEKKELLAVSSWPTWSTQGSEKYKVYRHISLYIHSLRVNIFQLI